MILPKIMFGTTNVDVVIMVVEASFVVMAIFVTVDVSVFVVIVVTWLIVGVIVNLFVLAMMGVVDVIFMGSLFVFVNLVTVYVVFLTWQVPSLNLSRNNIFIIANSNKKFVFILLISLYFLFKNFNWVNCI